MKFAILANILFIAAAAKASTMDVFERSDSLVPHAVQPVIRQAQSDLPTRALGGLEGTRTSQFQSRQDPSAIPEVPRLANGETCSTSTQCESGNCFWSICSAKRESFKYCYKDVSCESNNCKDHQCKPVAGTVENGNKCDASTQCTNGNYCRRGACDNKKPDGHVCYKDNGCQNSNCLDGKCVHPRTLANGARCTKSTQCQTDYCHHSRCDVKKANGHRCYKDAGCISGNCGTGRRCAAA